MASSNVCFRKIPWLLHGECFEVSQRHSGEGSGRFLRSPGSHKCKIQRNISESCETTSSNLARMYLEPREERRERMDMKNI